MAAETIVTVIGAGMAGSEAAWQAAERGAKVRLIEMRPKRMTPAHQTDRAAEIVCSNSFKSNLLTNASGVLKEEMRRLGSIIVGCADETSVPAGEALAVDREAFSDLVTERLASHPNITVVRDEAIELPDDGPVVIATGPLTSDALAAKIGELTGRYDLYFYDAVAPIVDASTIDYDKVFRASRYGKSAEADGSGDDDAAYLNCPMEKDEYLALHAALVEAEKAPMHDFESVKYFESCLPVEELASRGPKTLAFGPLKPVGLVDPRTGRRPYAVVQLRQENKAATLYNLVGFQTRLKWGEQKRVLRMIPGLENAEFVRFGVMHRNTYINSPGLLASTLQMREHPRIFFAGQIVGVEGYLESAAMGLVAGINAARLAAGEETMTFPPETILGSLTQYVSAYEGKHFAPMNSCWGLLPPLDGARIRDKRERGAKMGERALSAFNTFVSHTGLRTAATAAAVALLGTLIASARPASATTYGFAQPETIHCWAERGDLSRVAAMLAKNKSLLEQRQGYLGTPLSVAAEDGQVNVVAFLIRKGANVNARCPDDFDSQPVLTAACRGLGVPEENRMKIVKMLVDHNAVVRVVDRSGYTALHMAAYWGHADIVAYLLLKGADLMAFDVDGRTPFTEALRGSAQWDDWRLVRFIRMAVAEGADVNARTANGDTMLHCAVRAGKVHTVDFLIAQKADVNAPDRQGRTALTVAIEHGQTEVADLLRQNGGTELPTKP